jgi:hypothetical protein
VVVRQVLRSGCAPAVASLVASSMPMRIASGGLVINGLLLFLISRFHLSPVNRLSPALSMLLMSSHGLLPPFRGLMVESSSFASSLACLLDGHDQAGRNGVLGSLAGVCSLQYFCKRIARQEDWLVAQAWPCDSDDNVRKEPSVASLTMQMVGSPSSTTSISSPTRVGSPSFQLSPLFPSSLLPFSFLTPLALSILCSYFSSGANMPNANEQLTSESLATSRLQRYSQLSMKPEERWQAS